MGIYSSHIYITPIFPSRNDIGATS